MRRITATAATLAFCLVVACSGQDTADEVVEPEEEATVDTGMTAETPFEWPATLNVMGDGYPASGDPCRRLGESAATVNYLDDSAILVGCPGNADSPAAQALQTSGAQVVGDAEGVTLLSVPGGSVNVAPAPTTAATTATTAAASTSTLSGSVTGNDVAEETFSARSGQTINVTMTGRGTMYFNVLPPGGGPGDAIYVGSRDANGKFFSGVAPATGEYKIIVYLMGNDRDTGATRNYELKVAAE